MAYRRISASIGAGGAVMEILSFRREVPAGRISRFPKSASIG
jgi:hypothetical protein